jgi:hypothetical protein
MFYGLPGIEGHAIRDASLRPKQETKGEKEMENFPKNKAVETFNRERELFITVSVEAYRNRLLQGDKRPNQNDVAEARRISRATFNRQMAKYETSWQEIVLLASCEGCLLTPYSADFILASETR